MIVTDEGVGRWGERDLGEKLPIWARTPVFGNLLAAAVSQPFSIPIFHHQAIKQSRTALLYRWCASKFRPAAMQLFRKLLST